MTNRRFVQIFQRDESFMTRPHKTIFFLCATCLSFYFSYILFLADSPVFSGTVETVYCFFWFVLYAGMIFTGLCFGCKALLRRRKHRTEAARKREKGSLSFWGWSMGLSLFWLGICFAAAYPGGMTYDIYNQWMQFQTGQYNSWHPVLHTLLLGMGARVTGSYSGAVVLQLLIFSLAMAYLMETLRSWGFSKFFLLCLQLFILTTPLVDGVLMSAGKDSAMTVGVMVLCAQMIHLYFSRGEWMEKPWNMAAFGIALVLTTLVRHNGFFFTLPLFLCAFCTCAKQRVQLGLAAGAAVLLFFLVTGGLYGALDMVNPHNTLEESIGVPMTILLDVRAEQPEGLEEETHDFLRALLDDESFAEKYVKNTYNSIKFEWPREYINQEEPEKLLRMFLATVGRNPRLAFQSFNGLTDLVWDVTGKNEGVDAVRHSGDLPEYAYGNTRLNQLGKKMQMLLRVPQNFFFLKWLSRNLGVQMAILLLCGLWAIYRNGVRALVLCLPVLCYHMGTMLLLCGNDVRFFQFSMVICLPSALALWGGNQGDTMKKMQKKDG